jgi:hypothetical protein
LRTIAASQVYANREPMMKLQCRALFILPTKAVVLTEDLAWRRSWREFSPVHALPRRSRRCLRPAHTIVAPPPHRRAAMPVRALSGERFARHLDGGP